MNSQVRDTVTDAEMAALVTRFEQVYASLPQPEEPQRDALPQESLVLRDDAFKLPFDDVPSSITSTIDAREHEADVSFAIRVEPRNDPSAAEDPQDIEQALALLRSVEAPPRRIEARDTADLEPAAGKRGRTLRRYAVPALGVTIFIGVLSGYIVSRYTESGESNHSKVVINAPLRLDYGLSKQR